jgi:predicted urease superfamily metal-dependent hydrolase
VSHPVATLLHTRDHPKVSNLTLGASSGQKGLDELMFVRHTARMEVKDMATSKASKRAAMDRAAKRAAKQARATVLANLAALGAARVA